MIFHNMSPRTHHNYLQQYHRSSHNTPGARPTRDLHMADIQYFVSIAVIWAYPKGSFRGDVYSALADHVGLCIPRVRTAF